MHSPHTIPWTPDEIGEAVAGNLRVLPKMVIKSRGKRHETRGHLSPSEIIIRSNNLSIISLLRSTTGGMGDVRLRIIYPTTRRFVYLSPNWAE